MNKNITKQEAQLVHKTLCKASGLLELLSIKNNTIVHLPDMIEEAIKIIEEYT